MKWSQAHIFTLKEAPSDAEIVSQKLLIRGGYIRKLAPGIYTYSHLLLRAIRKFETIIREELDKRGCTEILMPMVQPRSLWEETGRWTEMGEGLLKFKNRADHWFCLGATHEEAVTDFFRQDLKSYRDLPRNLYQIQTKYRDEIRPRFGLMRGREFSMKDAYSFDLDSSSALQSYEKMYEAYQSIFNRLGLKYCIVQADAGNIGGSQTHEFQLLAESGEDGLLVSASGDFAANREVCPAIDIDSQSSNSSPKNMAEIEEFATPGLKTIEDLASSLKVNAKELVKTLFFYTGSPIERANFKNHCFCLLLRGSDEANPIKLKNFLKLNFEPQLLSAEEVFAITGAHPGSCGPKGLSIPIYADKGIGSFVNMIAGANRDGFHLRNLNFKRDFTVTSFGDFRFAKAGDKNPKGEGVLEAHRGIEVGHVFYLGNKYSEKMNLKFLDKNGKSQPVEMGCYGIGVTRTVQACLEQSYDADGIIWPVSIAPFEVHICLLDPKNQDCFNLSVTLEEALKHHGMSVLVDDRDERPGIKFKDADLLGMPIRVNIGEKGFLANQLEVIERSTKQTHKVGVNDVVPQILTIFENLKLKGQAHVR
jgi:prolyl-tRNA synthetase